MRTLPHADYTITTPGAAVTITGEITIDEYGYWATNDGDLILHVAHGHLLTITPTTGPVPSKADTARATLKGQAGR